MDQRIINLYDEYTHSQISRKAFMRQLATLTGSTTLALSILPLLENNYAAAGTFISEDITSSMIEYPGAEGGVKALLAKPKSAGRVGGVLVIHENRGLNPHIQDVTKRIASEGFIALGVDALSVFGGTPADEDEGRELIGKLDPQKNLQNYLAGLAYLRSVKGSNGKVGCVGSCWGGHIAHLLAVHDPALQAAVAYYGGQPPAKEVAKIKASVMLHYASLDERVNAGIPTYQQALDKNHIDYILYMYEDVTHAFNNETSPTRYDETAAKLAWQRTINFFREKLA